MKQIDLEARLNALDLDADWQSAIRTLRGIIEDLNTEIEELAGDGEA